MKRVHVEDDQSEGRGSDAHMMTRMNSSVNDLANVV